MSLFTVTVTVIIDLDPGLFRRFAGIVTDLLIHTSMQCIKDKGLEGRFPILRPSKSQQQTTFMQMQYI